MGGAGAPPEAVCPPPEIWSENNSIIRKEIFIIIDFAPPPAWKKFLEESQDLSMVTITLCNLSPRLFCIDAMLL